MGRFVIIIAAVACGVLRLAATDADGGANAPTTDAPAAPNAPAAPSDNASGSAQPAPTVAPVLGWPHRYARGVIGGPHDFSQPSDRFADACRACHVPHVQTVVPTMPPTTGAPTTQPVTTRPALAMREAPGQRGVFATDRFTPGPSSLVCLSCHDGTVATSTIGSAHAILIGVREGFGAPGEEGLRDHPIGVKYPSGRRDYRPESFVVSQGRVRLPGGRVECISCHDPHNEAGVDGMLVVSNRRSALCLTCHVK